MPRSVHGASLDVWRERLAVPENAARTAKELGVMFGVHASTVQYWRHKVADSRRPEAAPAKSSPNFLPVVVRPVAAMDSVVVRLPGEVSMVSRLCAEGLLPTVQLQQGTNVTRQAITKHLNLLESSGLVKSERVARDRLWRIEVRQLKKVQVYLDQISAQWDAALERLRGFVEEPE